MYALFLASLLSLPLYPVNPVKQDTVNFMNMHIASGITGPNGIVSTTAEFALKYELLIIHPFVVRAGVEYKSGSIIAKRFPQGTLHGPSISLEVLCYRGTNRMTGFVGVGLLFSKWDLKPTKAATDSLAVYHHVNDVGLKSTAGYRIIAGLRYRRSFSLEVCVSDIRPDFIYTRQYSPNQFSQFIKEARFNDFRITLGYLLSIKKRG